MADDLVISVGANIKALERQMKAAQRSSERAAREIEDRFRRVNPSISTTSLTNALRGFAAAFSMDRIIRGLADANSELVRIGDTAKRVGLDLQRFQELQFAARQNGLAGKDFGSGLEGLAERLNEARQQENALSKLFDENNLKLKTRKGEVISVNEALGRVAGLVQNAATEFDKIKIAEAVGLTRDWVPLLEQGAQAIDRQAAAAKAAGAVIDADIIQKAKEFERDWAAAIDRWTNLFKSHAGGIIGFIDQIIAKAQYLWGGAERFSNGLAAKLDLEKNGAGGAKRSTIDYAKSEFNKVNEPLPKALQNRLEQLDEMDREANRGKAFGKLSERPPLEVTVNGGQRKTNTSSLFGGGKGGGKGGGGSGSGKSDAESAQDRLDRYVETLMRQNSVLDAEIATFGKSNAEKRAAVELAKAQVDLSKLDETERQKVIASLTKEIELSEQKRTTLENLKQAQKGLNDAQKFFGEQAVDALEDLIIRGGKAEDVVKNLAAALARAALQAALLGTGPLAGIFGLSGSNGATGGLIGSIGTLFGRATGGPVNAGQAYRVGERGPETFVPTSPGKIVPASRGGGGDDRRVFNIDARGAQQGVADQIVAALRVYDAGRHARAAESIEYLRGRGMRV